MGTSPGTSPRVLLFAHAANIVVQPLRHSLAAVHAHATSVAHARVPCTRHGNVKATAQHDIELPAQASTSGLRSSGTWECSLRLRRGHAQHAMAAAAPAPAAMLTRLGVSRNASLCLLNQHTAISLPAAGWGRASGAHVQRWLHTRACPTLESCGMPIGVGACKARAHHATMHTHSQAAIEPRRGQQQQRHPHPHRQPQPQPEPQQPQQQQQPASPQAGTLTSSSGFKKTFYKRHLPSPPCTAFSSPEGRDIFAEALSDGTMAGFFKLMEQFSTQDEPAFCGLTSLSMVLNALAIDPRRIWKGAWRWFHEGMLDCCRPLDVVQREGITLEQAHFLARCNGARVVTRYHDEFSERDFRALVARACGSGEEHIVASYSRSSLRQTGDGHFSPIGGYHRGRDLVLILDVARFKYPPHWVPLSLLYHAMSKVDPVTQRPRGYMLMSAHHLLDSAMFTLDVRQPEWARVRAAVAALPTQLRLHLATAERCERHGGSGSRSSRGVNSSSHGVSGVGVGSGGTELVSHAVRHLLASMPLTPVSAFLMVRQQAVGPADRCLPHKSREALLTELSGLPLMQVVRDVLPVVVRVPGRGIGEVAGADAPGEAFLAERLVLLMLLHPPSAWPGADAWGSTDAADAWHALTDLSLHTIVAAEVAYLRQQFQHITDALSNDGSLEPSMCDEPACAHTHVLDCVTKAR